MARETKETARSERFPSKCESRLACPTVPKILAVTPTCTPCLSDAWEGRLERLRPTWPERGAKLERLLRASRVVLPGTLSVFAVLLIVFWNEASLRAPLIEYLAIAVYGSLYAFYWLLPRQREIFRIPFDEYIAKIRVARGGPFITPRGLVSAAFIIAAMVLLGVGIIYGFAVSSGGADPRTGYPFVGIGLWCSALGNLFAIPSFRKLDMALWSRPFTGRLLLAAAVAAIGGAILLLISA